MNKTTRFVFKLWALMLFFKEANFLACIYFIQKLLMANLMHKLKPGEECERRAWGCSQHYWPLEREIHENSQGPMLKLRHTHFGIGSTLGVLPQTRLCSNSLLARGHADHPTALLCHPPLSEPLTERCWPFIDF